MKVAYLGPKGTFSEEAAFQYFKSSTIEWLTCESILDVLDAVKANEVDKGFVPIENSIEGTINITLDGLLMNDLFISGEVVFQVALHLLTLKGVAIGDIKEIWSIPPALAQCRTVIRDIKAKSRHFNSTAQAAKVLKEEGNREAAAIASATSARTFDLAIAKDNVQDHKENHTRFVEVSASPKNAKAATKTMLLVTPTEERPGILAIILNVFSSLEINLTWIASRPTKKKLGTYRFFIEAEMGVEEIKMQKALTILQTYGDEVQILGSYQTTYL